jgi:hypothetical protein
MEINIQLSRGMVVECSVDDLGDGSLPLEVSTSALLMRMLRLENLTSDEVLSRVHAYLMSLEVPLPKYKITITQNMGETKKTLTYESPGRKEI